MNTKRQAEFDAASRREFWGDVLQLTLDCLGILSWGVAVAMLI